MASRKILVGTQVLEWIVQEGPEDETVNDLASAGDADGPYWNAFITELVTNDSDVEEEEEVEAYDRHAPRVQHQPLDSDDEDSDDDDSDDGNHSDISWKTGVSTFAVPPFTGDSGIQVEVDDDDSPFAFFHHVVNNEMIEHIAQETNRYAANVLSVKKLSPCSRFRKWKETTLGEMWAFVGLIIAMGLIIIEDLEDYWSTDPIYNLPLFRSVMTRDRFCLLMSFLHVCNNAEQLSHDSPSYDPLFKIRRFIDSLKDNFQRVSRPGRNIAIDEAMVAWRGRLAFRVDNPAKPDKVGIKVFELCDSQDGFCCNFEFYTGKQACSSRGASFDVVDRLIHPYLGFGRVLFVDNYYTSPDLFTYLKANNTLACGTLPLNRRNRVPKTLLPKLSKQDTTPSALTNGTLNLLRFFDRREVNFLTTAHDDSIVHTGKTNPVTKEPIRKLGAVVDHNRYMGAVDRSEQMGSYNAFKRRTLKWWKKSFFHLLMLGVLNSFLLYKKRCTARGVRPMTQRVFRRELAKQLFQWLASPPPHSAVVRHPGDSAAVRLSGRHFPELIQPKPGLKTTKLQRACVVCGGKKKSRYQCVSCDVGLHVDGCFKLYHTVGDYKRSAGAKRRLSQTSD